MVNLNEMSFNFIFRSKHKKTDLIFNDIGAEGTSIPGLKYSLEKVFSMA